MKGLDSLIRIRERMLEEKRRKVADLELLAARLRGELDRLEQGVIREQGVASTDVTLLDAYGRFASAAITRRETLRRSLAGLEDEMVAAVEDVAVAFREYKKFDTLRERNRAMARSREARAEQAVMNEAGLTLFRRR